jgi:hypothetical protein
VHSSGILTRGVMFPLGAMIVVTHTIVDISAGISYRKKKSNEMV